MTQIATFQSKAYRLYDKLPRPTLRWVCIGFAIWVTGGCDIAGYPLDSASRGWVLTFVAAVYGLRGFEKIKGVAA
jgi:hypothetical protein